MSTFVPFPKIPRLKRQVVITEKIDGTNAQVFIRRLLDKEVMPTETPIVTVVGDLLIYAGSRTRWIKPGKATDNFGFAAWVVEHAQELCKLGSGQHFGEWYGQGIQRGYGLDEKRFALFNAERWNVDNPNMPTCCEAVPVIARGDFADASDSIDMLREGGSVAVPGYRKPEGVVVWHSASRSYFKMLVENDDMPKGTAG